MNTLGYAAHHAKDSLKPFRFARRDLRPEDVAMEILYCGVCHSDLHQVRDDWHGSMYPIVPGHEIVGKVTAIGSKVKKYKVGDHVAVGCMSDSCLKCAPCEAGEEQFCLNGATMTYNGKDRVTGETTYGGYSKAIVVREEFVLRVPDGLDIKRVAPILCAGITTYSPLKKWNIGPGARVGIAGLGGLGHMGVKLAVGMGADVTVITTSPAKEKDAKALGAHRVLISKDEDSMKNARGSMDFILDTVPVSHDLTPYLNLLGIDGSLVIVGAIDMIPSFHSGYLLGGRKRISGSPIGGIRETQELLDLCAEKNILPDCEMIAMQDINKAYGRMDRADVKYRFVIDMSTLV
jgi:alcohol dehydrogenase (NADP+)